VEDDAKIGPSLAACESELAAGHEPDLRALGFWRSVAAVKARPTLVSTYADRIARIDRAVFARHVRLRADAAVGAVVLALGAAVGLLLLGAAASFGHPVREVVLLAGAAALDGTTHGLAHFLVGGALGIRFSDWFVAPPKPPGFKVDYASYLRARPASRAWMHASGAIATKVTPFIIVPYALAIGCDTWVVAVLVGLGVIQIATDLLFSVRSSDWMKFRREMAFARPARQAPAPRT